MLFSFLCSFVQKRCNLATTDATAPEDEQQQLQETELEATHENSDEEIADVHIGIDMDESG